MSNLIVHLGKVVYENARYIVKIVRVDDSNLADYPVDMYGVFNVDTGIREAELRTFAHAVQWADQLNEAVDALFQKQTADRTLKDAMDKVPMAAGARDGEPDANPTDTDEPVSLPEDVSGGGPLELITKEQASALIDGNV